MVIRVYLIMRGHTLEAELVLKLVSLEHEFTYENQKEWRTQVTDALHVAGGGMADRPREEDPSHHSLHLIWFENRYLRLRP